MGHKECKLQRDCLGRSSSILLRCRCCLRKYFLGQTILEVSHMLCSRCRCLGLYTLLKHTRDRIPYKNTGSGSEYLMRQAFIRRLGHTVVCSDIRTENRLKQGVVGKRSTSDRDSDLKCQMDRRQPSCHSNYHTQYRKLRSYQFDRCRFRLDQCSFSCKSGDSR